MTDVQRANIEAAIRQYERMYRETLTPQKLEEARADGRMQYEYPDRHVAFIDHWTTGPNGPELRREVVATAEQLYELMDAIADDRRAESIRCEFFDDPNCCLDDGDEYDEELPSVAVSE